MLDIDADKAYGQDEVDMKVKSRFKLTRLAEHRQLSAIQSASDSSIAACSILNTTSTEHLETYYTIYMMTQQEFCCM